MNKKEFIFYIERLNLHEDNEITFADEELDDASLKSAQMLIECGVLYELKISEYGFVSVKDYNFNKIYKINKNVINYYLKLFEKQSFIKRLIKKVL